MTSSNCTGEQWDAPNCWPPLTQIAVQALTEATACEEAKQVGAALAKRFVDTALAAFNSTGHMHEKYDALKAGVVGRGGEYEPQTGFGWTNGVVLDFLINYPHFFQS